MTGDEKRAIIREAWRLAHIGKFKEERKKYVRLCVDNDRYGRLKYAIEVWSNVGQEAALPKIN